MLTPLPPKPAAYAACLAYVQERLDAARADMEAAQQASNTDTKSSAGDKYETGRAMAQQQRDHHARQLHEAQQLLAALQRLQPGQASDAVRPGALLATSLGVFYVSIGAGRLATAAGQEFLAVSAGAPLVRALAGLRAGAEVVFNGQRVRVEAVE